MCDPGRRGPGQCARGNCFVAAGEFDQPAGDGGLGRRVAERGEPALQRAHRVGFLAARVTPSDVVEHAIALDPVEFAVDQRREPASEVGHCGPTSPAIATPGSSPTGPPPTGPPPTGSSPTGPPPSNAAFPEGLTIAARPGRRCSSAARNCARPRWILLRTVPSLTSRTSAISSYVRPSMSQSTTAARYSGGKSARAAATS